MSQATPAPLPLVGVAELPSWTPSFVALDLDGTCVESTSLTVHPRIAAAVAAAARRLPVIVATGRMYRSTIPWARQLGVTAPVICYQGALVREQPTDGDTPGATISEIGLDGATAQRVIDIAREHGWHRQAYINDTLICEEDRPEAHEYGHIARVDITYVADIRAAVTEGSTKLVLVIDSETQAQAAEAQLESVLGSTARVVRSLAQFVEITNTAASKSQGLRLLTGHLGLDMATGIAVGDAPNDTDMLDAVGYGIAIEGAKPEVMAAASARCARPEAGGVADVLETFGLA